MTRGIMKAVAVAALLGLLACQSGPSEPPPATARADEAYRIGPADRLQVRVWKNPELTIEAPVRPDGLISVPLLDDVAAAGLTAEEMKEILTQEYSEYISNPEVSVVVVQTGSRRVSVIGEVQRPGPIPLVTDLRMLEALSAAGGFSTFANRRAVQLIRYVGDEEFVYIFDYKAFIKGDAPGSNVLLEPGDTIVVSD
jgi:polysaccharide export outer membrane protein